MMCDPPKNTTKKDDATSKVAPATPIVDDKSKKGGVGKLKPELNESNDDFESDEDFDPEDDESEDFDAYAKLFTEKMEIMKRFTIMKNLNKDMLSG